MSAPPDPTTNNSDQPMTLRTQSGADYTLLPRDSGVVVHGWRIERHKGPISNTAELDDFQASSSIHCPEMSFLSNHLTLSHAESGVSIRFEAKEALKACSHDATAAMPAEKPQSVATAHPGKTAAPHGHSASSLAGSSSAVPVGVHPSAASSSTAASPPARLQVAAASKWSTKSYDGLVEGGVKQVDHGFDWTYTTKYKGELKGNGNQSDAAASPAAAAAGPLVEKTLDEIPIALLRRPDPILWYDTLPLFEDELHDNGVASLTVKIRVMDSCLLVLLQFWLRVDEILVRVYDTRLFHQFGEAFMIREQTCKENTFDELAKRGMPRTASLYVDPNIIGPKLTLKSTEREKIRFQTATTKLEEKTSEAAAAKPAEAAAPQ